RGPQGHGRGRYNGSHWCLIERDMRCARTLWHDGGGSAIHVRAAHEVDRARRKAPSGRLLSVTFPDNGLRQDGRSAVQSAQNRAGAYWVARPGIGSDHTCECPLSTGKADTVFLLRTQPHLIL